MRPGRGKASPVAPDAAVNKRRSERAGWWERPRTTIIIEPVINLTVYRPKLRLSGDGKTLAGFLAASLLRV